MAKTMKFKDGKTYDFTDSSTALDLRGGRLRPLRSLMQFARSSPRIT